MACEGAMGRSSIGQDLIIVKIILKGSTAATAWGAFAGTELAALMLGYAVSVHRAQGGEFPVVVLLLHDLHAPLLQRTVLYTALTRATQLCLLVGTQTAVE